MLSILFVAFLLHCTNAIPSRQSPNNVEFRSPKFSADMQNGIMEDVSGNKPPITWQHATYGEGSSESDVLVVDYGTDRWQFVNMDDRMQKKLLSGIKVSDVLDLLEGKATSTNTQFP